MKIIRTPQVTDKSGYSVSTIIRKAKDPGDDFPAARRIGAHGIGWIEEEIDAWIESRARVRTFEVDPPKLVPINGEVGS